MASTLNQPEPPASQEEVERVRAETALADSELRFQALVEASPLAVFALGPDSRPVFVSEGCAHLFGTEENRYDASGWIASVHADDRERAISEWATAVDSQTSIALEYRIHAAHGGIQDLVVQAAAMHTSHGRFSGWVGTVTDVTAQHEATRSVARAQRASEQARLALAARNEELQALAHAKDVLLAAVSHEFRTPITSIMTFLELLSAEDDLSPAQQQAVATIARNAERLERLVEDLLSAKATPGEVVVQMEDVEVGTLASEALAAAAPRARQSGIELELDCAEPAWARADPRRTAQVLDALLDNALKFTPAEGRVSVSVSAVGGRVQIAVGDSGFGIAADEIERVFERFYQGSAGRDSGRGSGLGLAVVRKLLDAQQATIALQSRPGCGTTAVVSLARTG